jgi:putative transposase
MMKRIDRIYTDCPWYGSRRLAVMLGREGLNINRKHVQRLMRTMRIEGAVPRRSTSRRNPKHPVFPYLLRNVKIERADQVWSTDITYVPLNRGFMYLTAVIDWYSRYVLSWSLSNTLDSSFCVEALEEALQQGKPEIFNTDQGVQFTSQAFVSKLQDAGVRVSMDGRGRWLDNVFIERLWRTVKHEDIYFRCYETAPELYRGLIKFFHYYNEERPHQALEYKTPGEVYREACRMPLMGLLNPEAGQHPREFDGGGVPAEEEADPIPP